jgi:hypothetical protein
MGRVIKVALLVLAFAGSLGAQAVPTGKHSATRWLLDSETGSDAGLGYKMPHIAFGFSFERQVGRNIELQGRTSFSPDRKYITNDGLNLIIMSTGLYWITQRFAVTGSIRRSNLWTSQFNKSAWGPSVGTAIRENSFGYPGRLYLDYLFPTGCQWGLNCRIQSNRSLGPEVYWEKRIASHFRLGFKFGFYHILNQSNELRSDIPRTGEWTGDTHVVMRFEFPRGSTVELY